MNFKIGTLSDPIAASSAKLDSELTQQLAGLAAEESLVTDGVRRVTPALMASAAWAGAALATWLAVAWVC
jgi:hypothetical protein